MAPCQRSVYVSWRRPASSGRSAAVIIIIIQNHNLKGNQRIRSVLLSGRSAAVIVIQKKYYSSASLSLSLALIVSLTSRVKLINEVCKVKLSSVVCIKTHQHTSAYGFLTQHKHTSADGFLHQHTAFLSQHLHTHTLTDFLSQRDSLSFSLSFLALSLSLFVPFPLSPPSSMVKITSLFASL